MYKIHVLCLCASTFYRFLLFLPLLRKVSERSERLLFRRSGFTGSAEQKTAVTGSPCYSNGVAGRKKQDCNGRLVQSSMRPACLAKTACFVPPVLLTYESRHRLPFHENLGSRGSPGLRRATARSPQQQGYALLPALRASRAVTPMPLLLASFYESAE